MSWIMIQSPRILPITRDAAIQWRDMLTCVQDRDLSKRNVRILIAAIHAKTFRPCEWAYCEYQGARYRVNGKHTSTVLAQWPHSFPLDLQAIITGYKADSLEDVANLYSTFDRGSSSKTSRDVYKIYSSAVPELAELSARSVMLAVNALAHNTWANPTHKPPDERAALLVGNITRVKQIDEIFRDNGGSSRIIGRVPCAVAALRMLCIDNHAAYAFWEDVKEGTGADPKIGDRMLRDFLLRNSSYAGRGISKIDVAGYFEVLARSIIAWNSWRKGVSTKLRWQPSKPIPTAV